VRDGVLVVLPTLGDRLDTLGDALRSVSTQEHEADITLVVVTPPGATAAREMASAHGAIVVDDPKRGLAGAMNAGLAARSDEKYYVGLGDDDLLRPGGIALLRDMLQKHPGAVVAYGGCDYIDSQSRVIGSNRSGALARRILSWGPNLVPHPGTLIDLDALEACGGFNESRPYTMDLDAFLSLKKRGTFLSTKVPTAAFRWHSDSLTVSGRSTSAREARLVKLEHSPRFLRPFANLWLVPVEWATSSAGSLVSRRSRRVAGKAALDD